MSITINTPTTKITNQTINLSMADIESYYTFKKWMTDNIKEYGGKAPSPHDISVVIQYVHEKVSKDNSLTHEVWLKKIHEIQETCERQNAK